MSAAAVVLNHYVTIFGYLFLLRWMIKILTYESGIGL
jgi:hypothetical protein